MKAEQYNHINDKIQDLYESGKLTEDDFDLLCKSVEKADKADQYRWHDLRKNPDDMPDVGCPIIILEVDISYVGKYYGYHGVYMNEKRECITPDEDFLMDIDDAYAWKYIELFEEVEE